MIEIDNVTKVYQMGEIEVHALRGVSLKIEKGECMMAFLESDESASTKHPENTKQGDMPV